MVKSYKPVVIEYIFSKYWNSQTNTLSKTVISSDDIFEAKRYCNQHLGTSIKEATNPYNFMKDIVRAKGAGEMWPASVREKGWTGQQLTGDGAVFEFIPINLADEDHLTLDFRPEASTPQFLVQSLSLPVASKALGRIDESWLLQVCVNLRIVETHLAVGADKQIFFDEVTHLQMDIKLRKVQIDALFLGQSHQSSDLGGGALITVEAKQGNQRILPEQIARQVFATFQTTKTEVIVPLALAAVKGKGVYVAEFEAVRRNQVNINYSPKLHRDGLYILAPAVKGIT